ncbi:pilin, partial [Neisseria gonorrhoeae]
AEQAVRTPARAGMTAERFLLLPINS